MTPINIPNFYSLFWTDSTEVVYGSRFLGRIEGMEPINRWANEISNWTFSFLYGVKLTDINTCYKVFTRRAWEGMVITSKNFAFETEFTVKLLASGIYDQGSGH